MENQINEAKLKKLEKLKAKQLEIEKQIKLEEQLSKNDIVKKDAIDKAKQSIEEARKDINIKNKDTEEWFNQLKALDPGFRLEERITAITQTPWAYITNNEGDRVQWRGETLQVKAKVLNIKHGELNIPIEYHQRNYSGPKTQVIRLGYQIVGGMSGRTYTKPKTVVKKIKEYHERNEQEVRARNLKNLAVDEAVKYLKGLLPKGSTLEVGEGSHYDKWSHRKHRYITYPKITIKLKNGNTIEYRVYTSNTEGKPPFTLSLVRFMDNRVESLKRNPEELINHLK